MKHLLLILISLLLLSSPVIGHPKGEHTLYKWDTSSGEVWKGFGDKETHPKYKGDVKNRKPNGLGIMITPWGTKYVGEWKNGKRDGRGTYTYPVGSKFVGEWKDDEDWNGKTYNKKGTFTGKVVNGEWISK